MENRVQLAQFETWRFCRTGTPSPSVPVLFCYDGQECLNFIYITGGFIRFIPAGCQSLKPALKLLDPELFSKIADDFFDDPDSLYRKIIDTTLVNYVKWADEQRHRQGHPVRTSRFPGDFSTTFELSGGRRVGVLGLNTTFLQLAAGDNQGRLAWDVRQFHAVCEDDGPTWAKRHDVCLLMTHQGPEWLNEPSRTRAYAEINPSGRFAVHHFGHAHENKCWGGLMAAARSNVSGKARRCSAWNIMATIRTKTVATATRPVR